MKSLVLKFVAVAVLAMSGLNAQAAFNISVSPVSGPGFVPLSTSATSGVAVPLPPSGGGTLLLNYNINNTPSSGVFMINSLNFFYFGNATPITLSVTISENAANFLGNGTPVLGVASFSTDVGSQATSTFSNVTTFTPGTGPTSINFPTTNFNPAGQNYGGATSFTSGALVGTVSTTFQFTITPGSIVGVNSTGGFGTFGVVDNTLVPAPPALFAGLFAVPTLALLRRRFGK